MTDVNEKQLLKDDPYEFYDDGEIEDLHTGADYQFNEAPAGFGLIGGALALLACLVVVGLMGAIYHRNKTSITLSHLIMACIGVVVAGLAAAICVMARGAMRKRLEPNHLLIGIALLLSIVMFGYFLVSSVYIFMYRPFHFGFLSRKFQDKNDWNDDFGDNWTFEDGWGQNRRMLWWVAFFSIVACIGFLIASICLWLLSKFPV